MLNIAREDVPKTYLLVAAKIEKLSGFERLINIFHVEVGENNMNERLHELEDQGYVVSVFHEELRELLFKYLYSQGE